VHVEIHDGTAVTPPKKTKVPGTLFRISHESVPSFQILVIEPCGVATMLPAPTALKDNMKLPVVRF
jgi:hypothetical protein